MPAIALVDRDGVYGSPRFHMAAKSVGIRAHVGAEISVEGFGNRAGSAALDAEFRLRPRPVRLTLLVRKPDWLSKSMPPHDALQIARKGKRNGNGHAGGSRRICRRSGVSDGRRGRRAGRLAFESRLRRSPQRTSKMLTVIFGKKNVYVEVQRHCDPAEERRNQAAVQLAETLHLPFLQRMAFATRVAGARNSGCLHLHSEPLRSSKRPDGFSNGTMSVISVRPQRWRNSFRICRKRFTTPSNSPHGSNTRWPISVMNFPRYPVPEGETMDSFLRKRTEEGFQNRYAVKRNEDLFERAQKQVQRELALIEKLKLAGLLPDCLGHRSVLPRAEHPRAGPRFGSKQRRLLFAGNYRGRSGRHGTAL